MDKIGNLLAAAECERDALRYRWLRDKLRDFDGPGSFWEHFKGGDYEFKQGASLDKQIDAAMKATN